MSELDRHEAETAAALVGPRPLSPTAPLVLGVPDLVEALHLDYAEAICRVAERRGVPVRLEVTRGRLGRERDLVVGAADSRGVVLVTESADLTHLAGLSQVVVVGESDESSEVALVSTGLRDALHLVIDHLRVLGHERVMVVEPGTAGEPHGPVGRAAADVLAARSDVDGLVRRAGAVEQLVGAAKRREATAFVLSDTPMASALVNESRRRELHVPFDLSVACVHGPPPVALALTGVDLGHRGVAEVALDRLFGGMPLAPRQLQLSVGGTTGYAPR